MQLCVKHPCWYFMACFFPLPGHTNQEVRYLCFCSIYLIVAVFRFIIFICVYTLFKIDPSLYILFYLIWFILLASPSSVSLRCWLKHQLFVLPSYSFLLFCDGLQTMFWEVLAIRFSQSISNEHKNKNKYHVFKPVPLHIKCTCIWMGPASAAAR